MARVAGNPAPPIGRWRSGRLPAAAAGLVLVEHALVDEVGSPLTLLRALRDLGDAWTDPVVSVVWLLALLAETLVAYVLGVLALRSVSLLPGAMGRIAGRVTLLVTPVAVRRLLDLVVGGALLAQATLAATPVTRPGPGAGVPRLAMATTSMSGGLPGPVSAGGLAPAGVGAARPGRPLQVLEPVETRPVPRRSAAPLPPWLGGGPSKPAPGRGVEPPPGDADPPPSGYMVEVGDTLWELAAAHLPATERSAANIQRYWQQVYRANRGVIGADPDLIRPGTRLVVLRFRRDR